MRFSTTSIVALALALSSKALGCVDFEASLADGSLSVTLTDNSVTTCTYNGNVGSATSVGLDCESGYSATFDLSGDGSVKYAYPGGSGTFATGGFVSGSYGFYYANVWC